ncbi:MAG: hypothetical protein ACQCN5_02000 [Candidatus Bathyarchaeia archaeon]|jgi:hypothetical protein
MAKFVNGPLMYGIIIVVIAIVVIGSLVGYTILNPPSPTTPPAPSTSPYPSTSPTPSEVTDATQTQARDETMTYIECNHPETEQYMQDLNWTGGRIETGLIGAEKYVYTTLTDALGSAGWTVAMSYPVVPNPLYTIIVNYTQTGVQNPVNISWNGTWQNGTITETGYSSNINVETSPVQEQVRNETMSYIQAVHVETSQFMQDLNWTGGLVETGLVGSVQYVYTTVHGMMGGAWWTVEIHNPVIPNPTYIVSVNYTQTGVQTPYNVSWTGTWQDSKINETSYSSNIPVTTEQIRDSIMNYIKINHNQTAQFMQTLTWSGGRVGTGLIVGSETYNYTTLTTAPGAAGWTMILQYPVVLNPIYTVSANYTQTGVLAPYEITWAGTWQAGTIYETNYTYVSP